MCAEYPLIGKTKLARIEQRAVRERWAVPTDQRQVIVSNMVESSVLETGSARQATAAVRCLIQMEAQNIELDRFGRYLDEYDNEPNTI